MPQSPAAVETGPGSPKFQTQHFCRQFYPLIFGIANGQSKYWTGGYCNNQLHRLVIHEGSSGIKNQRSMFLCNTNYMKTVVVLQVNLRSSIR